MAFNYAKFASIGVGLSIIVVAVYLSTRVKKDEYDLELNLSSIILGVALGWFAGMLISPYKAEVDKFAAYAGTVSAFLSGYFISKFDGVLSKLASPDILANKIVAFRVMISVTSFLVGGIITYVARAYGWFL